MAAAPIFSSQLQPIYRGTSHLDFLCKFCNLAEYTLSYYASKCGSLCLKEKTVFCTAFDTVFALSVL